MDKSIQDILPHRDPFLFVDEVLDIKGQTITTRLQLRENMIFFKGHYPGNPIFPGVLSCEAIMQSGGILVSALNSHDESLKTKTPVAIKLNNVKFKKLLKPGDDLIISVTLLEEFSGLFMMKGTIKKDGTLAVYCEFSSTLVEGEK